MFRLPAIAEILKCTVTLLTANSDIWGVEWRIIVAPGPTNALGPNEVKSVPTKERNNFPGVPIGPVTFLFADNEGSAKLREQLREGYAVVLSDQRDALRAAFASYHGHEIDTQGDAYFVAFMCAPDVEVVRVCICLHTGESLVARTGYVSMEVRWAARIAAASHDGVARLWDMAKGQELRCHAALVVENVA